MTLFAVTREAGRSWTDGTSAFDQPAVDDHVAFMNELAAEGVLLFAGPLAGAQHDRIRVLLIAEADDDTAVYRRLAEDPWEKAERIATTRVEPWLVLVGADRLAVTATAG